MVYWAFNKLNIHKRICQNACNVFLFILGGLVVPLGLFLWFLFTELSQMFLYTCIICSIIVVVAELRPWRKLCCCCECERNCPTATKFTKGSSSSSLLSFWWELLAFSYRYPQTQIVDVRNLPWPKRRMCFSGIFRLARSLAFFVLLCCPSGHNCCHVV